MSSRASVLLPLDFTNRAMVWSSLNGSRKQIEDLTRSYLAALREKRVDVRSQDSSTPFSCPHSKNTAVRIASSLSPTAFCISCPLRRCVDASNTLVLQNKIVSLRARLHGCVRSARQESTRPEHRETLLAVGNAPYQNQANVSAALVKPTGVERSSTSGGI